MKIETQIAEENIKEWGSCFKLDEFRKRICQSHKATCQRFLEFLRKMKGRQQKWLTYQLIPLSEKMIDLENTIKLYEDAGI